MSSLWAGAYKIVLRDGVDKPASGRFQKTYRTWADAMIHLQDVAAANPSVDAREYKVVST